MYVGSNPQEILDTLEYRYFYGLRRNDQGELFLGKLDYLDANDSISLNNPGTHTENLPNFTEGEDFFEGRDNEHELVYDNLNYEQFVWGNKNVYYYVNEEGELVLRINRKYTYEEGVSSDG